MEKILIKQNFTAINTFKTVVSTQNGYANEIISELLDKNIVDKVDKKLLIEIIKNPVDRIKAIYKAKIPDVDINTGLPNDKNKIIENLQIPNLSLIEKNARYLDYLENYKFLQLIDVQQNKSTINEVRLNQALDQYKTYATGKEAEMWRDLNQAIEILEKWQKQTLIFTKKKYQIECNIFGLRERHTNPKNLLYIEIEQFKKVAGMLN